MSAPALRSLLGAIAAAALVAGCGQKGPLVLPEGDAPAPASPTSPQPQEEDEEREE